MVNTLRQASGTAVNRRPALRLSRRWAIWGLLFAALLVRLLLLPVPGFDVKDFRLWAAVIAENGLPGAYEARIYPEINYPPVSLYYLWGAGRLTEALFPPRSEFVVVAPEVIKILPVAADLATVLAMLYLLRQRGFPPLPGLLPWVALYALHPAIIWNSAYWGGFDALDGLFALLAVIALARGRPVFAWVAVTLALLTKPLVAPILLLPIWYTLTNEKKADRWRGPAAAAFTAAVCYLPWLTDGRMPLAIDALRRNVGNYSVLSANGHNLWWLLSGGNGWRPDTGGLAFLSYRLLGLLLLALACYWTVRNLPRPIAPSHLFHAAAYLLMALPVLTTEAHENWAFAAFAPMTIACALDARLRPLFLLFSFTFLVNLAAQDPRLASLLWPWWSGISFTVRLANALAVTLLFAYWTVKLPRWLNSSPQSR